MHHNRSKAQNRTGTAGLGFFRGRPNVQEPFLHKNTLVWAYREHSTTPPTSDEPKPVTRQRWMGIKKDG